MPLMIVFSYYPVLRIGSNESMNFEFSLPLIWLVVFDAVGLVALIRARRLFIGMKGRWRLWLLFPVWVTLSVVWSLNVVRGVLTAGILWLLVFAGYVMWMFKDGFDGRFRAVWWKWFFGAALFACLWCVVQCVLDLVGVSQDYSLMCDGCTYHMFGFPHPNGFAIEPQFMGNLLLAPGIISAWMLIKKQSNRNLKLLRSRGVVSTTAKSDSARYCSTDSSSVAVVETTTGSLFLCFRFLLLCFFIITTTLFLTFSRGAIYAFVVGMLFMSGFVVFSSSRQERFKALKRVGVVWGTIVLSFVVVLNVQGLMAELGSTNDTYYDGVSKVLNHLSLGVIDIRKTSNNGAEAGNTEGELEEDEFVLVEKPVENSDKEEAVFSGYVAESTDTRVRLSGAAVEVWSQSPSNVLLGVGLGGAGFALYNNGLSPAPKEIVQNEYASLLLETGLIGVFLFVFTLVLTIRVVLKSGLRAMILSLLVAYGVSLIFFSGLPNALHIVLIPLVLIILLP